VDYHREFPFTNICENIPFNLFYYGAIDCTAKRNSKYKNIDEINKRDVEEDINNCTGFEP
jgi:hypothetical protein